MDRTKVKRGLNTGSEYEHLKGRLDSIPMLEDLGIDVGYRLGPKQIMCHCPDMAGNHSNGDANPSFGFNEELLAYNCFVCGGGSVVELVQMMQPGLSSEDAVKYLESFSDLTPGTQDDLQRKLKELMHPEVEKKEPMPDYPADALFQYRKIHPYLLERGLTKEIIVEMQVGFDEEHCGIVIPHWFQGRLRGWQTRHLVQNEAGEYQCEVHSCNHRANGNPIKVPKYKNTTNFPKVNTLYGYDRLKEYRNRLKHDDDDHAVLVVESPMTALKLMSMGVMNVVATFGQFNVEQGMLLLPYDQIFFWPDNDDAGRKNAFRAESSMARYSYLKIVPTVDKPKGDAADLNDLMDVVDYLKNSYSAALLHSATYPQHGLLTYEMVVSSRK